MLAAWQSIRSFFAGMPSRMVGEQPEPGSLPARIALVALVSGDRERDVFDQRFEPGAVGPAFRGVV